MEPLQLGSIGDRVIFENERVRIWEMTLEPGESSPAHFHENDYVVVTVEGDRLRVEPAVESDERFGHGYGEASVSAGEVFVLEAGAIEVARNVGASRYRDIQIEFKKVPG